MCDRQRLSKSCLLHGPRLPGKSWGVGWRRRLAEPRFPFSAQQQAFDSYLRALDLVDARIASLERAIAEIQGTDPRAIWSLACAACAGSAL